MCRFLRLSAIVLLVSVCACNRDTGNTPPRGKFTSMGKSTMSMETIPRPEPPEYPLKSEYIKSMEITKPMMEVLSRYDPEFRMWSITDFPEKRIKYYPFSEKSLPYAVKGDYNGDGVEDVALAGHNKDANIIVALMSSGTEYYVVEVEKSEVYKLAREHDKEVPSKLLSIGTEYYVVDKEKGKVYKLPREPGEELSFTPTHLLVAKKKGQQFVQGDMVITTITLKNDGFVTKCINRFDFYTTFTFTGGMGDFNLCEWDENIKKFTKEFLENIGEDQYIEPNKEF